MKESILYLRQKTEFKTCVQGFFLLVFLCSVLTFNTAYATSVAGMVPKTAAPSQEQAAEDISPPGPADEFDRGVPRTSANGFAEAIDQGDFEKAVEYMDMRNLPKEVRQIDGAVLAKKFKVVLDKTLWVDLHSISDHPKGNLNDGLPPYRDRVGQIQAGDKTVDILLQRVPRGDGEFIWKVSNRTVGNIPLLYEHHGYTELEEYHDSVFPDVMIFGWHSWQWASWLVLITFSYLLVWLPTWFISRIIQKKETVIAKETAHFFFWQFRLCLCFISVHFAVNLFVPAAPVL